MAHLHIVCNILDRLADILCGLLGGVACGCCHTLNVLSCLVRQLWHLQPGSAACVSLLCRLLPYVVQSLAGNLCLSNDQHGKHNITGVAQMLTSQLHVALVDVLMTNISCLIPVWCSVRPPHCNEYISLVNNSSMKGPSPVSPQSQLLHRLAAWQHLQSAALAQQHHVPRLPQPAIQT